MMAGAAIQAEQAQQAEGAMNGGLAPTPANDGTGEHRPEMATRASHVRQTLPNGQVGYVRQDSTRPPNSTTASYTGFPESMTNAGGQDDGGIAGHRANHVSPCVSVKSLFLLLTLNQIRFAQAYWRFGWKVIQIAFEIVGSYTRTLNASLVQQHCTEQIHLSKLNWSSGPAKQSA